MKTEIFKNTLELSVKELTEVSGIKNSLTEIIEKKFCLNEVKAGFKALEVTIYKYPKDLTLRIEEDLKTYVHTSIGLIQVTSEIGDIIVKAIKEKQEKGEYIHVTLLPL